MDQEILRRVQLVELEIAKEIKRVCDKHKIEYFLDGGTLLGAIRHNGFIPWDDDLDIGMLRKDYEKFAEIASDELNDDYCFQTMETEPNYGLVFGKVRKKNTVFLEEKNSDKLIHNGFFVDIFPYDYVPDSRYKQQKQKVCLNILKRLLIAKSGHKPWIIDGKKNVKKWFVFLPLRILSFFISKKWLMKKYMTACTQYDEIGSDLVFPNGISDYGRFFIRKDLLITIDHCFEDTRFKIPSGYDVFLHTLYGDYHQMPPEDKRYNRHGIKEIKF